MISFSNVTKRYPGGHEALKDVTFSIGEGELIFITGNSGAGKSTLLKLMAVIERPSEGSVVLNGKNLGALKSAAIPYFRRKLGLIFQDHKLLFNCTVYDNVALPLRISGYDAREAPKRVRAALDKVGLLAKEKSYPVALSGGDQQRLCIARAVVNRPAVVLADEPAGNLDHDSAAEILEILKSFHRVGVTVIIATHDDAPARRFAGRTLQLEDGVLRS